MHAKLAFGNVRKSLHDFGVYFVTILLGVAVFYAFNSITDQEAITFLGNANKMMELLGMIIDGVSVFIVVILAFLVIYADRFLIRRRKKEFGMYLCLGMRQSDVIKITALETLIVGAVSLAGGLVLGIAFSQALLYLTASLFAVEVPGFVFDVSVAAAAKTLAVFAIIFLIAALANSRTIMKAKLIDLLHADSKNEVMKLRSLPLSLVLFVVSCIVIGISYKLLIDNGLLEPSPQFAAATVLVCVGTVLFFYSLSGFLLRLIQLVRPVYLRGLNMFTLRQLNSKVNTTFLSMSVICITLFLAITSVCGGIGICNTLTAQIDKSTGYSATVRSLFGTYTSEDGYIPEDIGAFGEFAASKGYAMEEGLRESAETLGLGDFDVLVENAVQVDFMVDTHDNITIGDLDRALGKTVKEYAGSSVNEGYEKYPIYLVALSQVNDALALAGRDAIELKPGTCAVIADSSLLADYYRDLVEVEPVFAIGDTDLALAQFSDYCLETTPFPMNTGALVIPDEAMPETAAIGYSLLDIQCPSEEAAAELERIANGIQATDVGETWPISMTLTRPSVYDQSVGLSTIIAYLAIYIGFVLVMACAAILAIQQLSEASDNARRYGLLRKLGAPEAMIKRALLVQIAIYFAFPLVLAVAHSVCALVVVTDVVAVFGHLDIGQMAVMCAAAFFVVYGAYFLLTYFGAKRLARAD
ncbi:ABC transporter permease [Raoultibacter phocaeensis]|uniref:ABC transporter permease n=1 Tax=Raoultibacter phocaeensis TaxID=2479841 RepID=UPI00111B8E04|nr:ABC transporter permease [Raoultibacter phocaeensis]